MRSTEDEECDSVRGAGKVKLSKGECKMSF